MDTLLEEDGVEDVGEVALEEEEVLEEVEEESEEPALATRRGAEVEPSESPLMLSVAILTGLVLLLALPIVIGLSTDAPSSMATSLAETFAGKK
jgi:hypothetical protein